MEKLTRNSYPGILCGIIILVLTGLPGSCFPTPNPSLGIDKIVHVLMFAGFTFSCVWGYRKQYFQHNTRYRIKMLLLTSVISIAYGGMTEIMQATICYQRTGSWFDFIADSLGTVIGIIIFYLFFSKKK